MKKSFRNLLPVFFLGVAGCPLRISEAYKPATVYTMMKADDARQFDYYDPRYTSSRTEGLFLRYVGPVSAIQFLDGTTLVYNGRKEGQDQFTLDHTPAQEGDEITLSLAEGDEWVIDREHGIRLESQGIDTLTNRGTGETTSIEKAVVFVLERDS
jgi:hypothetical protein